MRRILTFVLLFAAPALAWNKPGHEIVAAFAYDTLIKTHPETVKKFITIMHSHPEWAKLQKIDEAVPEADRDRYLFMIAARWPDDIRNEREYHHGPWHYVDLPIVFPADKGRVSPEQPGKENALTALEASTKTVRNGTNPERQAVALCWISHLVGDLHQPLHACSLYSGEFPKGDRGGNSEIVRVQEGRAPINLHTLWDGLMTSSERYQTCAKIAKELEARPEFARDKLPDVDDAKPLNWAWQSYFVAVHQAYLDGKLKASDSKKDREAPILPEGYPQAAKAAAERQIAFAGYRLADQLVADLDK